MSTHNICFRGEIKTNIYIDTALIWSSDYDIILCKEKKEPL